MMTTADCNLGKGQVETKESVKLAWPPFHFSYSLKNFFDTLCLGAAKGAHWILALVSVASLLLSLFWTEWNGCLTVDVTTLKTFFDAHFLLILIAVGVTGIARNYSRMTKQVGKARAVTAPPIAFKMLKHVGYALEVTAPPIAFCLSVYLGLVCGMVSLSAYHMLFLSIALVCDNIVKMSVFVESFILFSTYTILSGLLNMFVGFNYSICVTSFDAFAGVSCFGMTVLFVDSVCVLVMLSTCAFWLPEALNLFIRKVVGPLMPTRARHRLFGKEFSSDVTGDGPVNPDEEIVVHYFTMCVEVIRSGDPEALHFVEENLKDNLTSIVTWGEFVDELTIGVDVFDLFDYTWFKDVLFGYISLRADGTRIPNERSVELDLDHLKLHYPFIHRFLMISQLFCEVRNRPANVHFQVGMMMGMRRANLINRGAARRGGPVGNFPAGDPRHVDPVVARLRARALDGYGGALRGPAVDAEPEVPAWNANWKKIQSEFIHSDFPKVKSLFSNEELSDSLDECNLLNPMGTPFCGTTAIDLAVGILPKVDVYLKRSKYFDSPFHLGSNVELMKWAHFRGVNLRVVIPYVVENIPKETYDYCNDPSWKWVVLVVKNGDGSLLRGPPLPNAVYHAFLVIGDSSDSARLVLPEIIFTEYEAWDFLLFFIQLICSFMFTKFLLRLFSEDWGFNPYSLPVLAKIVQHVVPYLSWVDEVLCIYYNFFNVVQLRREYRFVRNIYNDCNSDCRSLRDRRDTIEDQDYYAELTYYPVLRFFGVPVLEFTSKYFCDALGYPGSGMRVVSIPRVVALIKELQMLDTDELSLAMVAVLKANYLNTNDSLPNLYVDTSEYVRVFHFFNKQQKMLPKPLAQTVSYAALGVQSWIGNLNTVALNQYAVMVGKNMSGFVWTEGHVDQVPGNYINNGFLGVKMDGLSGVERREVAWAPFGSCYTDKGQVGPGHICVTEVNSVLAALAGRSMVKIPVECEEFFTFSKEVIDWLVDSMDESGIHVEEDEVKAFIANNQGKKSNAFIQSRVSEYDRVIRGGKRNKKFFRNSCFVKLEDSSKRVEGVVRVRPRLIMTMSDFLSVRLAPLIQVIDLWNHSVIERFQIKGCDPDSFIERIASFCDRKHIATDYSAFESSVSYMFKKTENYLIKRLNDKYRFGRMYRKFRLLHEKNRVLHYSGKNGHLKFRIGSRCSGDYLTSTFNCLINFLINAYSADKCGVDYKNMSLIVEGDDGITVPKQIDDEVINGLGFGFSANVAGSVPGDVDFLRKRWMYEGSLVNIGRSLKNLMWVTSNQKLTLKKQMAIIRAKALSYYFMSPGHPVITAMINYILEKTSGINYFNGLDKFLSKNQREVLGFDVRKIGQNWGTIPVNENLRVLVSGGALGFAPISVQEQLILEQNFKIGKFYLSRVFDKYDDIVDAVDNTQWFHNTIGPPSPEMVRLMEILAMDTGELQEILEPVFGVGITTEACFAAGSVLRK